MTRQTRIALAELKRGEENTYTEYEGFTIAEYCGCYQIRWFQEDIGVWHTWSPWSDSLEEAEHVCEKLIAQAETDLFKDL